MRQKFANAAVSLIPVIPPLACGQTRLTDLSRLSARMCAAVLPARDRTAALMQNFQRRLIDYMSVYAKERECIHKSDTGCTHRVAGLPHHSAR